MDILALIYRQSNRHKKLKSFYLQEKPAFIRGCGLFLFLVINKTDLTGIDYEPWHYRYVGKEAAKIIREEGLCLEEFVAKYAQDLNAVG